MGFFNTKYMNTKICSTCKLSKNIDDFYYLKSENRYRSNCKTCCNISSKRTRKIKDKTNFNSLLKKKEYNKKLIHRIKVYKGCFVCGIKFSECLDLHHVNMKEKEMTPSEMTSKSTEFVKSELRKCLVLCTNHHRMVHSGRIEIKKG